MDYQPNSHKSKEEALKGNPPEKRVEKAVTNTARVKKKSELSKFAAVFVSEDVKNVKSYILLEVLVPTIKKALSEMVTSAVDMILYGGEGRIRKGTPSSKVSYRDYYSRQSEPRNYSTSKQRTGYDFDDVLLDTRGQAEEVLTQLEDLISAYDVARVADLYDLVGITGRYTDNNYGWTDLRAATIERTRGGYTINFPRAVPLN